MKAVNPALSVDEITRLQATAWHDSEDSKVTNAINAFEVVLAAMPDSSSARHAYCAGSGR